MLDSWGNTFSSELVEDLRFWQVLINQLPLLVYVQDVRDRNFREIILWNDYCTKMLGLMPQHILGKTLFPSVSQKQADQLTYKDIEVLITGMTVEIPEQTIKCVDGALRIFRFKKVLLDDKQQSPQYLLCIGEDITQAKKVEATLKQKWHGYFEDPLTHLLNRASFIARLQQSMQRHKRYPNDQIALLYLDLDDFQQINDDFGRSLGDQLLQSIASRLQACLRESDSLGRFGEDEFIVLLEQVADITEAVRAAERIQAVFYSPFSVSGQGVSVKVSMGIVVSSAEDATPAQLLQEAKMATYRAKAEGKGCYQIFDPHLQQLASERLQLERDLHRALEREEFCLYYQPIVSLKADLSAQELIGFEGLIRWQHPERGLLQPKDFIAIAEETGLIVPMGWWILREAARQLCVWQQQFSCRTLNISLNLSGRQLKDKRFVEQAGHILSQVGLDGSKLKLELTESILMENVAETRHMIAQLKAQNIDVCLDDFGTGYSSLSYLLEFPVNTLKIDRSFVNRLESDHKHQEIVRSIIALANALHLEVIAEGIETPQQLEQLQILGCKQGQGYLFSKPVPQVIAEEVLLANFN